MRDMFDRQLKKSLNFQNHFMGRKPKKPQPADQEQTRIYGDPEYDASEDIYGKGKKIISSDLQGEEVLSEGKLESIETNLDIPGTELDDVDELVGEEDEENNYYSLGGDDHNDLEEDNGQ